MGKRIIQAVAGSGKTTSLVGNLNLTDRFLLVTYTRNNTEHLRISIIKKFGYFPANITLYSYFQFLIKVCYNPFLFDKVHAHGINWKKPPDFTLKLKRKDPRFYLTKERALYHNRIAKLCLDLNIKEINKRIDKYYDYLFFDEVQDLAGHDFNLMLNISPQNTELLYVGDFYQHTFDTSRDGVVNKNLHQNRVKYFQMWKNVGFVVDMECLKYSHRCSKTVCDFVRNQIGIDIYAIDERKSSINYVTSDEEIMRILKNDSIIKLFYEESHKYDCFSMNWAISKGLDDFDDVCVVLNKKTNVLYNRNQLSTLPESTKNKFYVACTRTKRNLFFIAQELLDKYKIKVL